MRYKHLKIENFKGIRSYETDLGDRTTITGDNGAGKTSILDAISWVLHGKNMENKKDSGVGSFNIKPLNHDGSSENVITHVALTIELESGAVLLERTLSGSKTEVRIDEAPTKLKDYERWIEDNIILPDNFRLFSDPLYFPRLPWKDQRDIFMGFFPEPSSDDVLATISNGLHPTVHEKLKTLKAEKIIENAHMKSTEFEANVNSIQSKIDLLNEQLQDTEKSDDYDELKARRDNLSKEIDEIEEKNKQIIASENNRRSAEADLSIAKSKLSARMDAIQRDRDDLIKGLEASMKELSSEAERLHDKIGALSNGSIDTICPACNQDLPEEKVQSAKDKIAEIIAENQMAIDKLADRYSGAETRLNSIKNEEIDYENDDVCVDLRSKIQKAQEVIDSSQSVLAPESVVDMRVERDRITETIGAQDRIEKDKERLDKYTSDLKEMARKLEESQRIEKDAGVYIRARAEFLLKSIEAEFDSISVILFKLLENGKTRDCFEIMRDGVPYSDLNRTGKLAAGLEFIKYFRKQESANRIFSIPVIIDNFESYPSLDVSLLDDIQTIVTKVVKDQKEIICQMN